MLGTRSAGPGSEFPRRAPAPRICGHCRTHLFGDRCFRWTGEGIAASGHVGKACSNLLGPVTDLGADRPKGPAAQSMRLDNSRDACAFPDSRGRFSRLDDSCSRRASTTDPCPREAATDYDDPGIGRPRLVQPSGSEAHGIPERFALVAILPDAVVPERIVPISTLQAPGRTRVACSSSKTLAKTRKCPYPRVGWAGGGWVVLRPKTQRCRREKAPNSTRLDNSRDACAFPNSRGRFSRLDDSCSRCGSTTDPCPREAAADFDDPGLGRPRLVKTSASTTPATRGTNPASQRRPQTHHP